MPWTGFQPVRAQRSTRSMVAELLSTGRCFGSYRTGPTAIQAWSREAALTELNRFTALKPAHPADRNSVLKLRAGSNRCSIPQEVQRRRSDKSGRESAGTSHPVCESPDVYQARKRIPVGSRYASRNSAGRCETTRPASDTPADSH